MRFVIASFGRPKEIKNKSLRFLEKHGIANSEIDIWLENTEQLELYKAEYPQGNFFITNTVGLPAKRNAVVQHYDEGQQLVCLDDDIEDIATLRENFNFRDFINEAFELCKKHKTILWGIYPCKNTFFMKNKWRYGLSFCSSPIHGVFNDKSINVFASSCEDVHRCVQVYRKYGGCLRFDGAGAVTKYLAVGGIDATGLRTIEKEKAEKAILYEPNKDVFSRFYEKKDKRWELVFKRSLSRFLTPDESSISS